MADTEQGAADLAFLAEVVDIARGLYARRTRRYPFGAYMTADGTRTMVSPQSAAEGEDDVVETLRLSCMRAGSVRTAVAYERIELDITDGRDAADVQRWQDAGKSLERHPKARMSLIVTVESEQGQAAQTCRIGRRGIGLEPRDPVFEPWGSEQAYDALMSGHYMRLTDRLKPEVRRWAEAAVTDLAFTTLEDGSKARH